MLDRTVLILLVFMILVGVVAYDRQLREKGEVSPVGRLLDYAGLSKLYTKPEGTTVSTKKKAYRDIQNNLSRLNEKFLSIETQRQKLVEDRSKVLEDLKSLNSQIQVEAEHYTQIIMEENVKFIQSFPEITRRLRSLLQDIEAADSDSLKSNFPVLKTMIVDLFNDWGRMSDEQMSIVNQALAKFEEVIAEFDSLPEEEIARAQEQLSNQLNQIINNFNDWNAANIQSPSEKTDALLVSTKRLDREYQVLEENYDASDRLLMNSNKAIKGKMQALTDELVTVTQKDFMDLMQLFGDLEEEQRVILDNLTINEGRVREAQYAVEQKLSAVVEYLPQAIDTSQMEFSNNILSFSNQQRKLAESLAERAKKIKQQLDFQWDSNAAFTLETKSTLMDQAEQIGQKSDEANKTFFRIKDGMVDYDRSRKMLQDTTRQSLDLKRSISPREPISNYRNNSSQQTRDQMRSVDNQYQRLKDSARDRGF